MLGVLVTGPPGYATMRESFGCLEVARMVWPLLPHVAYGAGFAVLLGVHHLIERHWNRA